MKNEPHTVNLDADVNAALAKYAEQRSAKTSSAIRDILAQILLPKKKPKWKEPRSGTAVFHDGWLGDQITSRHQHVDKTSPA